MSIREQSYYALAALMDGPLHGYAIIKRAEELSGGRVRMAAGTLYAALDRLSAEGLLRVVDEEVVNGRARRYYDLTDDGLAALHAEADRMVRAARVVNDRPVRRVQAARPA
ncbi:PadR family transcriptional regulator [Micromonospora sp. KC721]|uniref:PadR family transcriptional regulator n=1 Tax=Micromonospora sp. KC721 TaxID=2530380 RepID=UPI00104FA066|nr:PadR family transcriptional regulator [Micromonospora sp. KC721]TDB81775.1 PadR family transcriptional regulator [Micromonospora sp. KC721]